ncbi:MAG: alpha/beta hydrolase [Alphaproteobacteria bacterium]|nr:alpha/beta hydrolase [Alphaproteobacteria bacterium]|tara:strand:+ start:245 stop:1042 length:798 start_codon:yes stop_codon:yes gene_type:complete
MEREEIMPYAPANGIKIYYENHGLGPPIVFAHGRSGCHLSWWQQVSDLRNKFQCITFDHRGFDYSKDVDDGPARKAFADDQLDLLNHLDIERAFLVGQSMGGWTCLSFAITHPDRTAGLVLADTSADINDEKIFAAYCARGEPPANIFDRALSAAFKERDPAKAFLYAEISALSEQPKESLMDLLLSRDGPAPNQLADLQLPTLFIVGEDDIVVPPEIARLCADAVPKSRLEIVKEAGHSVYFEQPEIFSRLVDEFVSSNVDSLG